ncbi:putative cytochrome P450 [Lophiotrema nucula]|uniref:Putative cytochrome P450 n=1 Tax=Lophiotrema nucula TaxID=690887 RepID=A0A6A5YGQ6_9PLEO|nr:putative cytochrome P450 [Lophiotrema nucula]
MIALLFFGPIGLWIAWRHYWLLRNYIAARKYGLPIIVIPTCFEDAWWILLRPLFAWVERLPFNLGYWYIYTEMGWVQQDTNKTLLRLNTENFILCSPTCNQIVTAYPPALDEVVRGHKKWPQPGAQSQLFAFYGQNVSSTNGLEWQRHRKITASAFNENNMHEVWSESIKRAGELGLDTEQERTLGRIRTTFDVLAMHVLATVGFGQDTELKNVPYGHRESLMESLGFILKHIVLTLIFNGLKAPDFLLPNVLKKLKVSVAEFRLYMQELVHRQMQMSRGEKKGSRTNLLEAIVTANEAEKQIAQSGTAKPSYLSESELYGNLFVFNLAGYETTASSMTFALSYLATDPEIQDWLIEEVDRYFTNNKDYASVYPRLVRCQAWMNETLRFASPSPLLVRTPWEPDDIPVMTPGGEKRIVVPPGTLVGLHQYGAHLSSRWGVDADKFDPRRFVSTNEKGNEILTVPDGVAYLPFMFGPRICPGKKFAQVEFVAIVAQMLSEYRVEVLRKGNETEQAATARLMGTLKDKYFNISAHLKRPEDAGVRFVKRRKE